MKVQLVDADEERDPVFVKDGDVEFKDPRMIAEMGVHMINVTFPEPGEYRLQLLAAGDMVPLMERRILVMTVPQ